MREIKFRVLIDREMYYQDKYEAYGDNLSSIDICKETITITSFYNYEDVYRFENEEVKLMQYTGVKDKNGKEIYEGDIVLIKLDETSTWYKTVVGFKKGAFIANLIDKEDYVYIFHHGFTDDDFEIIGNVYENKNLLEENKWANTKYIFL